MRTRTSETADASGMQWIMVLHYQQVQNTIVIKNITDGRVCGDRVSFSIYGNVQQFAYIGWVPLHQFRYP